MAQHPPSPVRPRLIAVDQQLAPSAWRSLEPGRERAHTLVQVATAVLGSRRDPLADAFEDALVTIALAMQRGFPDNIFGDLDFLAASLWRHALAAAEGAERLRVASEQIAALQEQFGHATAIRFRYVHDFLYGFDWAKWVAREPEARARVEPFDPPFIAYMHRRGGELLELIASGRDRKYPPLPDGRPRNPFGFSREPSAEVALHRHLAREGLLPVEAWCANARPRWDRPYAALRKQAALRLGLGHPEPAAELAPE